MTNQNNILEAIEIDFELMRNLEILHFDMEGYKTILKKVLTDKEFNTDVYNHFMGEYKGCNRIYELTKRELIDTYIPKEFNNPNYTFSFNFFKDTIEIMENGKGCNC